MKAAIWDTLGDEDTNSAGSKFKVCNLRKLLAKQMHVAKSTPIWEATITEAL